MPPLRDAIQNFRENRPRVFQGSGNFNPYFGNWSANIPLGAPAPRAQATPQLIPPAQTPQPVFPQIPYVEHRGEFWNGWAVGRDAAGNPYYWDGTVWRLWR
jgi:hypothetical protein